MTTLVRAITRPLPNRSITLTAGVFFLFAPIGFLIALCPREPWPIGGGIANAAFAGLLALGWAQALRSRRYALAIPLTLVPLIAGPLVFTTFARLGLLELGASMGDVTRRIALASLSVACLALGFLLIVRFIRSAGVVSGRWKAELDLGQKIHERLVRPICQAIPGAQIVGQSDASAEMGGDLLELVGSRHHTDIIVGDVSGHGVAAGVVMALVKGGIHVHLRRESPGSPSDMLIDLAHILDRADTPCMFVTMACVRITHGTRRVEIAMAGHNPILWWRTAERRLESIANQELPLGILPDEAYTTRTIDPGPGDWLLLYTDGLFEVTNADGHMLGIEGFTAIAESTLRSAIDASAAAADILGRIRDFGRMADDQTIALIRLVG